MDQPSPTTPALPVTNQNLPPVPNPEVAPPQTPPPPIPQPPTPPEIIVTPSENKFQTVLKIIAIVAIVLAILATVGFFLWRYFLPSFTLFPSTTPVISPTPIPTNYQNPFDTSTTDFQNPFATPSADSASEPYQNPFNTE